MEKWKTARTRDILHFQTNLFQQTETENFKAF